MIVGDSIGNQIDSAPVEQITGETWFNYSYGQATLAENISLLEDLIDSDYPIKRIVWSLAFSRVRDGGKNEMARSLEFVDSPAWHLFTFESLRGVYYVSGRTGSASSSSIGGLTWSRASWLPT